MRKEVPLMEIEAQNIDGHPLEILDNARAYEAETGVVVLAEVINRSQEPVANAAVFATAKDEFARLVTVEEAKIGPLFPGERRPVRLTLAAPDPGTIVGIYVGAYRALPTCRGTMGDGSQERPGEWGDQ